MKHVVVTTKGQFDFEFGELVAKDDKLVCRDKDGTAHVYKGVEIVALMRADFFEEYAAKLAALEQLQNRTGRYED